MTTADIKNNLEVIRKVMDAKAGLDDPQGVATKLEALSNVLGLSAECIAYARKNLDKRLSFLTTAKAYQGMSATDRKMVFSGEASEEIFMVNYSESLNKDVHYVCESVRSLLSYLKQEMQNIPK